ncbi:Os07g0614650, partial [Oryza sativa Japonica Group]
YHTVSFQRKEHQESYNTRVSITQQLIPFSAFWLRSSVVSVLISLISDMWTMCPL